MIEQYSPSNSTEGFAFIDKWCRNCARDKAMREGLDINECDDNESCNILALSFIGPVKEWIEDERGPRCTAFVPADEKVPPPKCEHTRDLFDAEAAQ